MEAKRTCGNPSKELFHRTLLLITIFASVLGPPAVLPLPPQTPPPPPPPPPPPAPANYSAFCSKYNFVWGGWGGVASFTKIIGKVPKLLTSIVDLMD